ncbi:polyprenyl synthetase family protein, partial [Streptomyces mangrovisoli]|uniref:polyprenyl synthetase family protein n=1 Tax=Streptomyces mangrovisoli TaxID=1428628 RepID=UPI0009A0DA2F
MSPTVAKDHLADRRTREHPPSAQGSPTPAHDSATPAQGSPTPPRRPADDGRAPHTPDDDGRAPHTPDGDGPHDEHAPAAVDADVTLAVRGVLGGLLDERLAAARAVDPLFAADLAERVARFTEQGGKFSRSRLVWWALRACGGGDEPARAGAALRIGAALELIQTCALVHDDVMDDALLRRGRPTLHVDVAAQYEHAVDAGTGPRHDTRPDTRYGTRRGARLGEAAAILAGDLALAWADDIVAETELPPATARRVRELWSAMRLEMVAGQYLDVQGEATSARSLGRAVRAACLKSALYSVERPLALGAALADADPATARALSAAGRCVGLAFQLRDDLLDAFGDPRDTGKPAGGDIRSGKPTWLAAVTRARAESSGDTQALAALRHTLGLRDASELELATVREAFETTGARHTVEDRIERLTARGLHHLHSARLEPRARDRLDALLRAAAGTRPTDPDPPETRPTDPSPPEARPTDPSPPEAGPTAASPPGTE